MIVAHVFLHDTCISLPKLYPYNLNCKCQLKSGYANLVKIFEKIILQTKILCYNKPTTLLMVVALRLNLGVLNVQLV